MTYRCTIDDAVSCLDCGSVKLAIRVDYEELSDDDHTRVVCINCGNQGPPAHNEDFAVVFWNALYE